MSINQPQGIAASIYGQLNEPICSRRMLYSYMTKASPNP